MSEVRFIRKHGRIIPIRKSGGNKERNALDVAKVPAAIPVAVSSGIGVGGAVYKTASHHEKKLFSLKNRIVKLRFAANEVGAYKKTSLKSLLPTKPNLFDWGKAQTKLKRFETARMRVAKFAPELKKINSMIGFIGKNKFRLSIGAGILGGLAAGYSVLHEKDKK